MGTAEVLGDVVLLDGTPSLLPRAARGGRSSCCATPVVALRGDRFILRDETARWTLGGGTVVNPFAHAHRRAAIRRRCARWSACTPAAPRTLRGRFSSDAREFAVDAATLAQALDMRDRARGRRRSRRAGRHRRFRTRRLRRRTRRRRSGAASRRWCSRRWPRTIAREPLAPGSRWRACARGCPGRSRHASSAGASTGWSRARRLVARRQLVRLPSHRVRARPLPRGRVGDGRAGSWRRAASRRPICVSSTRRRACRGRGSRRCSRVLEREGRVVRIAPDLWCAREPADEALVRLREHCRAHGEITARGVPRLDRRQPQVRDRLPRLDRSHGRDAARRRRAPAAPLSWTGDGDAVDCPPDAAVACRAWTARAGRAPAASSSG